MKLEHTVPTQKIVDAHIAQAKELRAAVLSDLFNQLFRLPLQLVRRSPAVTAGATQGNA